MHRNCVCMYVRSNDTNINDDDDDDGGGGGGDDDDSDDNAS